MRWLSWQWVWSGRFFGTTTAGGHAELVSTREEASDVAPGIGARVRQYRKAAGLSGVKLAAAAGVSQPFLSQLESGRSSVTINTLYRISHALGVHPADLLPAPPRHDYEVVRSADSQQMSVSDHLRAASARAIFRANSRITELYDFDITPGEKMPEDEWFTNRAESALYVLEGRVKFEFETRPDVDLEAGDALFYRSATPHRWRPADDHGARAILIVSEDQISDS